MAASIVLYRRLRSRAPSGTDPEQAPAPPELQQNLVDPGALDHEGWREIARQLLAQGEFRLAQRALYLGCVSELDNRGLLKSSKTKTVLDYRRELERHRHAYPEAETQFHRLCSEFEVVWYGQGVANGESLRQYQVASEGLLRSVSS